jgi:hypothetical protein
MRAASAAAASFTQTISSVTYSQPVNVPKPQRHRGTQVSNPTCYCFAVIAHVNTGFDLFADHMGGDFHLTSPPGGIDWLAGFLADQQV